MANSVFREKQAEQSEVEKPQAKEGDKAGTQDVKIDPPYTDYEKINNHPYIVDHFKLGDTWRDELGGFEKEVTAIEDYLKSEIERGQLQNDIGAVKEKLNKIYKFANIENTERTTMKIEKLAAYLEFIRKTDDITKNYYKYSK